MGGGLTTRDFVWLFFGFTGRISRKPYFLAGAFLLVLQVFLLYRFTRVAEGTDASAFWAFLFTIVAFVSVISNIALTAKRLHDINRTGWIAALFIIAGFFMYVFLCLIPGTPGPNRYGDDNNAPV